MKKILYGVSLIVVSASLALAQDSATTSGQSAEPTSSSNNAAPIQGCLSGSDGNYTLTQDGSSATFKLVGLETQLKKHVGHEVAISGEVTGGARASANSASDPAQAQPSAAATAEGNTIQVTNVKMVSKQCGSANDSNQSR